MDKAIAITLTTYVIVKLLEVILKTDNIGYWKGGILAVFALIALIINGVILTLIIFR